MFADAMCQTYIKGPPKAMQSIRRSLDNVVRQSNIFPSFVPAWRATEACEGSTHLHSKAAETDRTQGDSAAAVTRSSLNAFLCPEAH